MIWQQFISPVCLCLAAICNAVMDSVENEHIAVTMFDRLNPNFWNKRVSWNKAKRIGGYKFDAWHMSKSSMLGLLTLACVLYRPMVNVCVDIIILWVVWNIVFNLFYNKIFAK